MLNTLTNHIIVMKLLSLHEPTGVPHKTGLFCSMIIVHECWSYKFASSSFGVGGWGGVGWGDYTIMPMVTMGFCKWNQYWAGLYENSPMQSIILGCITLTEAQHSIRF